MQSEKKKTLHLKTGLKTMVDSHSDLACNVKTASPTQQKDLRRSPRLSVQGRGLVQKASSRKSMADCGTKSSSLGCILNQNVSAMSSSPGEITSLLHLVSLGEKHSVCNESNVIKEKETLEDIKCTSMSFSPAGSVHSSVEDTLKSDVANIIDALAEETEGNENSSTRQISSSDYIEDALKSDVANIIDIFSEETEGNENSSTRQISSSDYIEAKEEPSCSKDILKGVTAYVEVRSGHENRTKAIERQLHEMGAKTIPRFLSTTTHVIFKEGRKSTRDKAVARNIPLVSVLWVESCKQQKKHVPEEDFPAVVPEIYDSPIPCRRIRKLKSMQPKDFSSEFAGSIERLNKILGRIRQDKESYSTPTSFRGIETTDNEKKEDAAVVDNGGHTLSSHKGIRTCRLFGLPQDKTETIHLGDKRSFETASDTEVVASSSDTSVANKSVIKRRKLLSDLNQSPHLKVTTPRKTIRNKAGLRTSFTHLTDEISKHPQNESGQCTKSPASTNIDGEKTDMGIIGSDVSKKKENSRSSLDDFENKCKKVKHFKTRRLSFNNCDSDGFCNMEETSVKKSTIVLTSLQSVEKEVMYSLIASLGGFRVKHTVTETTTHVVSGDSRRTLNVLFGLVRGCWILSSQWVYKSLEAGHWLEEEPFQFSEYLAASQISHQERAKHGPGYCQNLFGHLGNMFVSSHCNPSYDSLTELVRLAGGKISTCLRKCELLIGPFMQSRRESTLHVFHLSEKWVLDCISQHRTLPFDSYKI